MATTMAREHDLQNGKVLKVELIGQLHSAGKSGALQEETKEETKYDRDDHKS